MSSQQHVFLFGDQAGAWEHGLQQILQRKRNGVLTAFHERAFFHLRHEIGALKGPQYNSFARFSSLSELLKTYTEASPSKKHPALAGAFCTLYHLSCVFRHYGKVDQEYPAGPQHHAVGYCTGLLAAAAVSCSSTVAELLPVAVEAVLTAFRIGLLTADARTRLESEATENASWAAIAPFTEEEAREFLRQSKNLPSQPYVSAVTPTSVTISAPSHTIDRLVEQGRSIQKRLIKVAITAPYHAQHLYDEGDVNAIIEKLPEDIRNRDGPRMCIYSNSEGAALHSSSFGSLLESVVTDILRQPLRLDLVQDAIAARLQGHEPKSSLVLPVAATGVDNFVNALRKANDTQEVSVSHGLTDAKTFNEGPQNVSGRPDKSRIAIIGFSGRFPEADGIDEYWDVLSKGLDVHKQVPLERWNVKTHYDPSGKQKNSSQVQFGCWIKNPGMFDARFFNLSPREAAQSDPAQRLALMSAYEALEMAGFIPDSTPSTQKDRVGIMLGTTSDDYREVNSGQDIDTYFIPGGNRAFFPGRINYHFKFSGPSYSVDTACSSSFASIHLACNALWRGECDTAIGGGTNVLTNPDNFAGLDRGHFLSRTGNCNTFDDGADGYCRADSVGVVVMKRLEDAIADNDPILATINGAATNHSAEAVSITRPHVGAQEAVFDKILSTSGTNPDDVSYVEMHGTGTQAGDASEMQSVLKTFAPQGRGRRDMSLHLGSAKSNIGHAESASGVASLIKVLLMLRHNTIPPHCGIKGQINHGFPKDMSDRNVHIARETTEWARNGQDRKAFLNNFSAAGGNTALMLEEFTGPNTQHRSARSSHVVALSAKTKSSLTKNINALSDFLLQPHDISIEDLSYTTTARRLHHDHRAVFTGANIREITEALNASRERDDFPKAPATGTEVSYVFTGQGASYLGMGEDLLASTTFADDMKRFDHLVRLQGFESIMPIIESAIDEQAYSELPPTSTQLALTCVQMALANLWKSWGFNPASVIGHSLGDYAALYTCGALSASETIYLVGNRATLLQRNCSKGTHGMVAIKLSVAATRELLGQSEYEIACINGPQETVISGVQTTLDGLVDKLSSAHVKFNRLNLPYAFHSAQVSEILEEFKEIAKDVSFKKPSIPFHSALYGCTIRTAEDLGDCAEYLSRHCRETVNFLGALEHAEETASKNHAWLEIGPHPICSSMIKAQNAQTLTLATLRRSENPWKTTTNTLASAYSAGIPIAWKEYHSDAGNNVKVLHLPSYQWDLKRYWMDYTNDWCLQKGNASLAPPAQQSQLPAPQKQRASRLTTSVQYVVEEETSEDAAYVIAESDVSDPTFRKMLHGHKVNGTPLCPSSAYADMAMTVADYLHRSAPSAISDETAAMEIADMNVNKPLIARDSDKPQLIRIRAQADWIANQVDVSIYSVDDKGKITLEHGNCKVYFKDGDLWSREWSRMSHFVRSRISTLHEDASTVSKKDVHRVKHRMFYRLFSALVEYGEQFRGYDEAILSGEDCEATGTVSFKTSKDDGDFFCCPYWIDSLGQIGGFTMNANDSLDTNDAVFVNHGWEAVKITKRFDPSKTYETYVKMQPSGKTSYSGDVYIFEGETVVALYQHVTFQQVPRRVLDSVLPKPGVTAKTPLQPAKSTPKTTTKASPKSSGQSTPALKSAQQAQAGPQIASKAFELIAAEVGVNASELKDDEDLTEFGIDSLLSLTITGKLREELNLDVDSGTFTACETVRGLRGLIESKAPSRQGSVSGPISDQSSTNPSSSASDTDDADSRSTSVTSMDESDVEPTAKPTAKTSGPAPGLTAILAEEIGVKPDEVEGELAELGLDSLMSLTVLSRAREELGLDLPADFFAEHESMESVSAYFGSNTSKKTSAPAPVTTKIPEAVAPVRSPKIPIPKATSVLLQGSASTATKHLFLFPDGSGSSASYAALPTVDSSVAVYGMNCPFLRQPASLHDLSLGHLTPAYVNEIRRRRPHGPYYVGGWSAGGIAALDAVKTLRSEGEQVERLILLDSPNPVGLEKLPPRLYDFLNGEGAFGGHAGAENAKPPAWLVPHFMGFIDALDAYTRRLIPCNTANAPNKVFALWARDGVCPDRPGVKRPEKRADDPREMWWLLDDRKDFGPNGWDGVVGGHDKMTIETIEGASHFSMMKGKAAGKVSSFLKRAMA